MSAGTTLTMAVLSGWLLTVANTGDSNAVIDAGDDVQEITFSHRIQVLLRVLSWHRRFMERPFLIQESPRLPSAVVSKKKARNCFLPRP
jgi:hypothetical protein